MNEISIRAVEASDAHEASPLIFSSGPAAFTYLFTRSRKDAVPFLRFSFEKGKALFGYRNHAVAVHQGKIVGTISFYTKEDLTRLNLFTALDIANFYGWITGLAVIWRGLRLERFIKPPTRGRLYLAHIGVIPPIEVEGLEHPSLSTR